MRLECGGGQGFVMAGCVCVHCCQDGKDGRVTERWKKFSYWERVA